jgi:hypothetical protein
LTASQRRVAILTGAIGGIGVVVIVIAAAAKHSRTSAGRASGEDPRQTAPGRTDFPYGSGSTTPARPIPETPEEIEADVTALMSTWRDSVIHRDADTVLKLDGIFRAEPARYASALSKSATSDPDAHVRAFSTRMLGKLVRPDSADVFAQLLSDQNAYVRQNAAWALGELARAANGQLAGTAAPAALRRARQRDPNGDVRSAARGALDQLQ